MAINRDPTEWFERLDLMEEAVYGILKRTNEWVVLKKEWMYSTPKVSEVVRVPTREAAIGFIKLLVER